MLYTVQQLQSYIWIIFLMHKQQVFPYLTLNEGKRLWNKSVLFAGVRFIITIIQILEYVDGLVQDCSNSIANTLEDCSNSSVLAMELPQPCAKPSMYHSHNAKEPIYHTVCDKVISHTRQ